MFNIYYSYMLSSCLIQCPTRGGGSVGGWIDHLQQAPPEQIRPQRITIIIMYLDEHAVVGDNKKNNWRIVLCVFL